LRIVNTKHHRLNDSVQRDFYRIKDAIVYEISVEQHTNDGKWRPFTAASVDPIQLELIMLDPHVRVNFIPGNRLGLYVANAILPDVYGVFTFKVEFKRRGWSFISVKNSVPVHPFRHNEYPRYLSAAYPYYSGASSVIVGFWLFSLTFLFLRESKPMNKPKTA
jgi:oligosaccharyltransferase complex subunit beta